MGEGGLIQHLTRTIAKETQFLSPPILLVL